MENLRQIEDDLRSFQVEVDKKYPEVAEATSRATLTLRSIRESYISSIRNKNSSLPTPKLPQSSDLLAPFILLCNYADAPPKVTAFALNSISILLQFEVVPYSEIKNIVRVLCIQVQSSKFDAYLKLLQLTVLLATCMIRGHSSDSSLSDHSTVMLLSVPLQLTNGKHAASVQTAAMSTAKQLLSLMLDDFVASDKFNSWLSNSCILFFDELVKAAGTQQPSDISTTKIGFVSYSFALDSIYEILSAFSKVTVGPPENLDHLFEKLGPMVITQLGNIRKQFDAELELHGTASSSGMSFRIFRLARMLLLHEMDSNSTQASYLLILLFHCLQPEILGSDSSSKSIKLDDERSSDVNNIFSKISLNSISSFTTAIARHALSLPSDGSQPNSQKTATYDRHAYAEFQCGLKSSSRLLAIPPAMHALEILIGALGMFAVQKPSATHTKTTLDILAHSSSLLCGIVPPFLASGSHQDVDELSESPVVNALRKYVDAELSNPFSVSSDHFQHIYVLQEYLSTTVAVTAFDLVCMSLLSNLMSLRIVLEQTLIIISRSSQEREQIEFPRKTKMELTSVYSNIELGDWMEALKSGSDAVFEGVVDCANVMLRDASVRLLHRSAIVLLNETCLVLTMLGKHKQSELALSALCKHSVPVWHEKDLMQAEIALLTPSRTRVTNSSISSRFEGHHALVCACLLRNAHLLCNSISDWDCIVDCFDQLYLRSRAMPDLPGTGKDVLFLAAVIDRFPAYSAIMSDESLVKFVTSLVALSMNSLSNESNSMSLFTVGVETFYSDVINVIQCARIGGSPQYLSRGLTDRSLSFPFKYSIETAKCNSHRISCIWQMVISHIRIMASMKTSVTRTTALVSLFDVMLTAVSLFGKTSELPVNTAAGIRNESAAIETEYLPADQIFSTELKSKTLATNLKLGDLFSCLKSIAAVNHADVRLNLLKGLFLLIQESGEVLGYADRSGWRVVIEILSSIPYSMWDERHQQEWTHGIDVNLNSISTSEYISSFHMENQWPSTSLQDGFACLKLMVDEFMAHFLADMQLVSILVECLSLYAAQSSDINMSLTAVELLWKVSDASVNVLAKQELDNITVIVNMMLSKIFKLSLDSRPEVRNGAVNTFYSTTTAYSFVLSPIVYRTIFSTMIFHWFDLSKERIDLSSAPGNQSYNSKQPVHHSRDSPLKQWSETRVLSMRGLLRLVRSCARFLVMHSWFSSVWEQMLQLCVESICSTVSTLEQASAGVDFFFGMLQLTSEGLSDGILDDTGHPSGVESVEKRKLELWSKGLRFLPTLCQFSTKYSDLAVVMCQRLQKLYSEKKEAEFRYSENFQLFALSLPALVRAAPQENSEAQFSNQLQFNRSLMEVIRCVEIRDSKSRDIFLSALMDIMLSARTMSVCTSHMIDPVVVRAASNILRNDVKFVFTDTLNKAGKQSAVSGVQIFCREFLSTVCRSRMDCFPEKVLSAFRSIGSPIITLAVDDSISVVAVDNEKDSSNNAMLLFTSHADIVATFCEIYGAWIDKEGGNFSMETENLVSTSLAFFFTPWVASSEQEVKSMSSEELSMDLFRRLIALTLQNSKCSDAFKSKLIIALSRSLLQSLILIELRQSYFREQLQRSVFAIVKDLGQCLRSIWLEDKLHLFPVRLRALEAIVLLMRQVSNVILSKFTQHSQECLLSLADCLDFMINFEAGDLFESFDSLSWHQTERTFCRTEISCEQLWLECLLTDVTQKRVQKSSHLMESSSHVFCLYHHWVDIASLTEDSQLRTMAFTNLRSVDFLGVIEKLHFLTEKINDLASENNTLLKEVHEARSAAAFPF